LLKHADPESTVVELGALDAPSFHDDADLSELALLKDELREVRREICQTRETLEDALRLARRRDRIRAAARAQRQSLSRGGATARAILHLMVAVFTIGGAIAGGGVAVTVVRVWGGSGFALVAAVVFGLATALAAWLLAALAAMVVETADSVRKLPA
jgi:hypothetical protein